MKAIVFEKFGPSSVLTTAEVPAPTPRAGEILVKITHTSVNPVDWKIREGHLESMLPHQFPVIPGWDAAGVVVALGAGVKDFALNDEVYAYTRLPEVHAGTYAELIALPSSFVARKPKSISPAQAAAVPLVALTAYQALHEIAKLRRGDKVLITGGAGGVGSFAIQFAAIAGAVVTATASTPNLSYLRELGAAHVIDYKTESVADAGRKVAPDGFDVIFDGVGGDSLTEALQLAKADARIVSIVDTPPRGQFHFVYPNGKQLAEIGTLFDSGTLELPAIKVTSVKNAATAQDENAQRHVRGKVVLAIDF